MGRKILLGVTGSVAALKTPLLAQQLRTAGHDLQIVATRAATYFFDVAALAAAGFPIHRDEDEWPGRDSGRLYQREDPVLHIELRRWADLFVIAPLDANTLAKLAGGLCDNCLTCVWRAWDPVRPLLLAPAMNTFMWDHPLTRRHFQQLAEQAGLTIPSQLDQEALLSWINEQGTTLRIIPPISKRLACGDVGVGAMAALEEIVQACA